MFEIYKFNPFEMLGFILIFIRIITCFATWPVFGAANIPVHAKVLASLMLTFVLFPVVGWQKLGVGIDSHLVMFLTLKEVFIGMMMGLSVRMVFMAVSVCGELVSLSAGLSADQMFNPSLGHRSTILEQFYILMATMIFFSLHGHYILLSGLVHSFDVVPLSSVGISLNGFKDASLVVGDIVLLGIKMAAPVFASIFFMNIALGLLSRAAPQINILVTSLAVNVMIGVIVMILALPLVTESMAGLSEMMGQTMVDLLTRF
jgi:flagellar biosynthetic protein FliR